MKKGRILRLMFILAVTTIMIAATAVVASAATVNKNDADYKYSKTYDNGVKISFTANFNWDAPVSLEGRTASFKVKTYNNAKYKAYSYDSKPKKVKIK